MKRSILFPWLSIFLAAATAACGGDDDPPGAGPGTASSGAGASGGAGGGDAGGGGQGGGDPVGGGGGQGGGGGTGGGTFHDPANGAWQSGFSLPGLSGFAARASAIVKGPDGNVYVGGIFTEAGGVAASNVAMWDGAQWHALSSGLPGHVKALAFGADGSLYAGGSFATDASPNHLARWDGTSWAMLPGDVSGDIDALATQGDRILVAGGFLDVASLGTSGVAAHDAAGWSAIGTTGTDWDAHTILVTGEDAFCIGGGFSVVDSVPVANAACWTGSEWSAMGDGLPGIVKRLAEAPDGTVFAGGSFTFIVDPQTGEYEASVASLQGGQWQPFEGGVDGGFINEVRAIAFAEDGDLLIGGTFNTVSKAAVAAQNVARWDFDGAGWSDVAGGVDNDVGVALGSVIGVNDILVYDADTTFVGGLFSAADDGVLQAANVARLEDGAWKAVVAAGTQLNGVGGLINDLALDGQGNVVAGGYFPAAGSVQALNVARLGPAGWEPLGEGLDDVVRAVHVLPNGDILAGGNFFGSGNTLAPFFARWDGSAWAPVGPALDGQVTTILEAPNGDLYVGGDFVQAGSVSANHVARWDGAAWSAVGDGFDDRVTSLAFDGAGRLVATGLFRKAGATTVNGLAVLENDAWKGFGDGFDGADWEYGSRVAAQGVGFVVAGSFTSVDGTPAPGIARWDGSQWSAVGDLSDAYGFGVLVSDVLPYGDGVFATGTFTISGDENLSFIGWHDGATWHPLAGGLGDLGESLLVQDATLWVGGGFVEVNGRPNSGIAAWAFED